MPWYETWYEILWGEVPFEIPVMRGSRNWGIGCFLESIIWLSMCKFQMIFLSCTFQNSAESSWDNFLNCLFILLSFLAGSQSVSIFNKVFAKNCARNLVILKVIVAKQFPALEIPILWKERRRRWIHHLVGLFLLFGCVSDFCKPLIFLFHPVR